MSTLASSLARPIRGVARGLVRPRMAVLAAAVIAVALGALLALRAWPSETLDAATVLSRSDDARAQILAQATEGEVLRYRTEEYLRQGPAAPLVQEMRKDDFYVPESVSRELWSLIGSSGKVVRVYGRMTDEKGNLVQEVTTGVNQVVTRAPASGAEERWPMPSRSVEDIARDAGAGGQAVQESIAGGAAKVVGYDSADGRRTIVLELRRDPEPQPEKPVPREIIEGYTLPYTLDLAAVERIERMEVFADSYRTHRWWMVAVDAAGQEHLVSEVVTVVYDVLEPADVPAAVLAGT